MKNNSVKVSKTEPYGNAIVCRGKLRLIEADNGLFSQTERGEFNLMPNNVTIPKGYNPIIISKTEKVVVGDMVNNAYQEIIDYTEELEKIYGKYDCCFTKILALPENFSTETLKCLIEGTIKDGDEVFIECEKELKNDVVEDGSKYIEWTESKIKLNKENYINIFPAKKEVDNETWNEVFRIAFNPDISFGTKEAMVREKFNAPTRKNI